MNTRQRLRVYREHNRGAGLTDRQRRRVVKKGARESIPVMRRDDAGRSDWSRKWLAGVSP